LTHRFLAKQESQIVPWETIYVGGGTPSLWGDVGAQWFKKFQQKYPASSACEFTLEANPLSLSPEMLDAFMAAGVNRLSIGTQSMDDDFLKILGRDHNAKSAEKALKISCKDNLRVTADLMIGLPKIKKRNVKDELQQIIDTGVTHLSVYILTVKENYRHNRLLPDDSEQADEYLLVSDYLQSHGFTHYEVSNFAKDGHRSRHNQKYWDGESVLGLGPGATGLLLSKDEMSAFRYKWVTPIHENRYEAEELSSIDLSLERIFLRLRTDGGIDGKKLFPEQLPQFSKIMNQWLEKGLVTKLGEMQCCATPRGYLQLDFLVSDLFELMQ